ncbi:hypothetical protein B0T22DRAFT_387283 [Podospora appendiculata]|uniref:Heterokaryon incompatibility domain-containing protein n=1 Tax=Podospora appendiculata TaxID=314037 RepID=A0AAE1C8Q4_9PEZI|nr:hypothetical protein B0T22DRAFT_387283 [Podospora appendiculata]
MVVPHLNLVSYDRKGFTGFLGRLGYKPPDLRAMLNDGERVRTAESILQEWLYFGLLDHFSDVSGIPIDLERFVDIDEKGIQTVTSQHWPEFFALIAAKELPFTEEQHEKLEEALNYVVQVLAWVVNNFDEWYYSHLTPSVLLSIFILVESLYEALRLLSGRNTHISTRHMSPSLGKFFEKQMRDNGWCMASIQGVLHGNASVAYFASLLPSVNPEPHPTCTDEKCFQAHLQVGDFTVQHAGSYCPGAELCCDVVVKDEDLISTLDAGSFPAIQLRVSDGNEIAVNLIDAQNCDYVAISHVWAHGLGNPDANAMPACQLRRLFDLASRLLVGQQHKSRVLWIDTLCVPVHSKPHRKMSISRLRDTYKRAAKVLVLDRGLARVSGTNVAEAVCHLLCSDWMSRLWTLQEGLLPELHNLFVQFQDGPVPASALVSDGEPKAMPDIVESKLRTYLSSRQDTRLLALMRDLQRRRTTRQTDEPICIATLMNIDLGTFDGMPCMADIYRSLGRLPRNLIFAPGPRLTAPGFRWAPSTFLEQPITGRRATPNMASLGLAMEQGFDFMALSVEITDPWVVERDGRVAYKIEFPGGEVDVFFLPSLQVHADLGRSELGPVSIEKPNIVIGDDQGNFSQPAVVIDVTGGLMGRTVLGRYSVPGFIVQMDRASPRAFRNLRYETIGGKYPLFLNCIVD